MCVIEMEIAMEMWLGIYTGKVREEEKGWVYGTADDPGAPFPGRSARRSIS
jgi:hypothetical protein